MNLDAFVTERESSWTSLDRAIASAKGRPERLGPDGVRRVANLYRTCAADLALARRKWPSDPVVQRLEDLVRRAHPLVYDTLPAAGSALGFFTTRYWALVSSEPRLVAFSAALMLGSALLAALWGLRDPAAAIGALPAAFRSPGTSHGSLGLTVGQSAAVSSMIFTNNIKVTFVAFAGGITAGALTSFMLVYNGVILGVLAGISAGSGTGARFFALVLPHGVLELSCIVVAAAAGLRLARGLLVPGRSSRAAAVAREARPAIEVVLGTAPWLVLAGLVEGFLTPSYLPPPVAAAFGLTLGAVYWALVVVRGRAGAPVIDEPSSSP